MKYFNLFMRIKNMSYKRKNSLMILIFISGLIMILLLFFYSIPNESFDKYGNLSYKLNLNYLNSHPRFDWFNGLWLDFACFFTILILEFLEFPNIFTVIDNKILLKIKCVKR